MILFGILLAILVVLALFMVLVVGVGGAAFTILFSDVIVCMALIIGIIVLIIKKRR